MAAAQDHWVTRPSPTVERRWMNPESIAVCQSIRDRAWGQHGHSLFGPLVKGVNSKKEAGAEIASGEPWPRR